MYIPISLLFGLLVSMVCLFSPVSAGKNSWPFLCGLVASTNISSLYSDWACNTNGNTVGNPCNPKWYGLTCTDGDDDDDDTVTQIILDNTTVAGTIPSSLGSMSKVLSLAFKTTAIYGTIHQYIMVKNNGNHSVVSGWTYSINLSRSPHQQVERHDSYSARRPAANASSCFACKLLIGFLTVGTGQVI